MTIRHRFFLIAMLLIIPAAIVFGPGFGLSLPENTQTLASGSYFAYLDNHIRESFPFQDLMRRISIRTGLLSGRSMQNDIFISREGLIKNIPAPNPQALRANIEAIIAFSEHVDRPIYFVLIPTSSAILQQMLPQYAQIYNNQRQLIEDVYRETGRYVVPINVYPVLFNRRSQYIYYRTENNLTSLGGFYVYSALAGRLGIPARNASLDRYDISYPVRRYFGNLHALSPYSAVRPDELMTFHLAHEDRMYTVTHMNAGEVRTYYTLYPTHLAELGREMDIFFGGVSAITRIESSVPGRSILVLGDHTALSYIPFLAGNYQRVTLVDVMSLTSENLNDIRPGRYHQILIAYSVQTFNSEKSNFKELLLEIAVR